MMHDWRGLVLSLELLRGGLRDLHETAADIRDAVYAIDPDTSAAKLAVASLVRVERQLEQAHMDAMLAGEHLSRLVREHAE